MFYAFFILNHAKEEGEERTRRTRIEERDYE